MSANIKIQAHGKRKEKARLMSLNQASVGHISSQAAEDNKPRDTSFGARGNSVEHYTLITNAMQARGASS